MQKTDNRTNGGRFEQVLSGILAKNGFWSHVMQQNKSGQPADIIAVKGKYHTLIDCKVVSDNDGFPLSRIEENQWLAMKRFVERGGEYGWFAIRLPDESVWMMNYGMAFSMKVKGIKGLSEKEIRFNLRTLENWLKETDTWSKDI